MNAVLALKKNVFVQVPATVVTISLMIALPFLVHLAPPVGGIQMGAIVLPIFYAALVAVFLFHPAVSIVAAMLAPYINYLIMGRPTLPVASALSVEVLAFSGVLLALHRKNVYTVWAIPAAYLLAKIASGAVSFAVMPGYSLAQWSGSIVTALPGLLILSLLYALMLRATRDEGK
jgi:hypothetical protein